VNDWIEVTEAEMDPAWVVFDQGKPGTVLHELGGGWWCRRCFTSPVASDHVCQDIATGGRRWVLASLVQQG
jgi:hypothetical protein